MSQDPFAADEDAAAPAVIGMECLGEDEDEAPSQQEQAPLYVPCKPVAKGSTEVELELRTTEDDELALVVYSDLETLVSCCGEVQPWLAIPADQVEALAAQAEADFIARDVELTDGDQRHG